MAARPRPRPAGFRQGTRRRAGAQQSPAGPDRPQKRRAAGGDVATYYASPYQLGSVQVVPGRTRTAGFYGRYTPRKYGGDGETKLHDVGLDLVPTLTAGSIAQASFLTIAQGTTESTRIGRKLIVKSFHMRYAISLPLQQDAADIGAGDVVRVILYQDKQANGAAATVTGILESADYQSFNQLANKSRFRTLYECVHNINRMVAGTDGANTVGSPVVLNGGNVINLKLNMPIEYDNTATDGSIATMRSNNIGLLLISGSGTAGFLSSARVRFSDG